MDPLTIGLITAGFGGFAGWMDFLFDNQKAQKQLNKQKDLENEQYKLQLEEAELEYEKAKKEANRSAEKARLSADLTDQAQDITERTISNDINSAIDNLYLSQQNDTYEWNLQAMENGSNAGASYAGLAASGVRAGSSMSDAVELQSATNAALLQFSQDAKRRSDNNNLGSVLNQLAGNEFNIMQNRIGADQTRQDALDLVNSYLEGGSNYNIYQNRLKQMENAHNYNLGQINEQLKQYDPKSVDYWLRAGSSILTGGSNGFSTGYNVGTTAQNVSSFAPNYTTSVKTGWNKRMVTTDEYNKLKSGLMKW